MSRLSRQFIEKNQERSIKIKISLIKLDYKIAASLSMQI